MTTTKTVTKKVGKKKSYGKKKSTYNKTKVNAGLGFPKRMTMTHKYHEIISLNSTLGAIAKHSMVCNGMYDPNATGTGHQPMFFDQMSALYNHYTVIGSKIRVVMSKGATSGTTPIVVGTYINDDTTSVPSDINSLLEQTSTKYMIINENAVNNTVITRKWSAKKAFGGSVLANDELQGTSGANPVEQQTYTLFAAPMDSSSTIAIYVEVFIEYIAVWKELKDIAGS